MKKRILGAIIALMTLVVSTSLFTACSEQVTKFKVEFMDGDTVLKTENVVDGEKVAEWENPTVEGSTFMGWYATPGLTHEFDFDAVITKDTKVYGGFVTYQADDRDFYLVGSGTSPSLKESNWGNGTNTQLTAEHTATANKFTITTDLYAEDQFQIAINGLWHNKRGFGYIVDPSSAFISGGGLGDADSKGSNIKVLEDGNYTITLTTYPAEDYYNTEAGSYTEDSKESHKYNNYDTITIVDNGDIVDPKPEIYNVFYIKGEKITNWQDVYSADVKMTKNEDVHTLTKFMVEGDKFMFTSRTVDGGVESATAGTKYIKKHQIPEGQTVIEGAEHEKDENILIKQTGLITFTYNETTDELTATCDAEGTLALGDTYITGLEPKADDATKLDWSVLNADKKFVKAEDSNIYTLETLTVKEGDQFKVQVVTEGATSVVWSDEGKTDIASYNYQKIGKTEGPLTWDEKPNPNENANADFVAADLTGEWPNYNIKATKAGTYRVTYDAYSNLINFYLVEAV